MGKVRRLITVTREDGTTYQRTQWFNENLAGSVAVPAVARPPKGKSLRKGPDLTEAQETFLQDSKVVTKNGKPMPVYHGAIEDFDRFDENRVGRGNDSWGNGFYFASQRANAEGYGTPKEFYLDIRNPIRVDGRGNSHLGHIEFTKDQAKKILREHPDLYIQPNEENEIGSGNFLQDYLPEFWDSESHSREGFEKMSDRVIDELPEGALNWINMESMFGRDNGSAYLRAVEKVTEHDGVIVDLGEEHGEIIVAWRPNQIKLVDNLNPDSDSDRIDA